MQTQEINADFSFISGCMHALLIMLVKVDFHFSFFPFVVSERLKRNMFVIDLCALFIG